MRATVILHAVIVLAFMGLQTFRERVEGVLAERRTRFEAFIEAWPLTVGTSVEALDDADTTQSFGVIELRWNFAGIALALCFTRRDLSGALAIDAGRFLAAVFLNAGPDLSDGVLRLGAAAVVARVGACSVSCTTFIETAADVTAGEFVRRRRCIDHRNIAFACTVLLCAVRIEAILVIAIELTSTRPHRTQRFSSAD